MKDAKNEIKTQANADIFLLLAVEAEGMMKRAGEEARKEAAEMTEKFLREYEQQARQIVLKTRERAAAQAEEIVGRLRESLVAGAGEASVFSVIQAVTGFAARMQEIGPRLQASHGEMALQVTLEKAPVKQALAINQAAADGPAASPGSFEGWVAR